jgi:hypothetical protein
MAKYIFWELNSRLQISCRVVLLMFIPRSFPHLNYLVHYIILCANKYGASLQFEIIDVLKNNVICVDTHDSKEGVSSFFKLFFLLVSFFYNRNLLLLMWHYIVSQVRCSGNTYIRKRGPFPTLTLDLKVFF